MARISPATKAAIVARLREDPPPSRYAIAKEFGVTQPTVVNFARDAGLPVGVQSPVLREAVEANVLVARGKRAALAEQALDEAKRFLDTLWTPTTLYHFDAKEGEWVTRVIPNPLESGQQSKMISFGIAVDKAMAIAAYDSEGPTASKIAIITLVDQLRDESEHEHGITNNTFAEALAPLP